MTVVERNAKMIVLYPALCEPLLTHFVHFLVAHLEAVAIPNDYPNVHAPADRGSGGSGAIRRLDASGSPGDGSAAARARRRSGLRRPPDLGRPAPARYVVGHH